MAFKTNFKDEIVSNGRTRQIIDANTGGVIHDKVQIKNAYTPDQIGDKLGADWINAVGQRLNNLESGEEKAKIAESTDYANTANTANNASHWCTFALINKGVAGTPNYVPGWSGTLPADMYFYNPLYMTVGNADKVDSYHMYANTIVVNPVGNNYIDIVPPSDAKAIYYCSAINSNYNANNASVISRSFVNNKIRIFLNTVTSNNIQIDYIVIYR